MWYCPPHGEAVRDLDLVADRLNCFYASCLLYLLDHRVLGSDPLPPIGVGAFDNAYPEMQEYLVLIAAGGLLNPNAVPRRLTQALDAAAAYPFAYLYLNDDHKLDYDPEAFTFYQDHFGLDYIGPPAPGADPYKDDWRVSLRPLIDLVSWQQIPEENPHLASVAVRGSVYREVPNWPLGYVSGIQRDALEELAREALP